MTDLSTVHMMQFTRRDGPRIGVVALLLHRIQRVIYSPRARRIPRGMAVVAAPVVRLFWWTSRRPVEGEIAEAESGFSRSAPMPS